MNVPLMDRNVAVSGEEYLAAALALQGEEVVSAFTWRQQGRPSREDGQNMREIFEWCMADSQNDEDEPEITIVHTHALPTRCIMKNPHGLERFCSDELIRIQATNDYPTLEQHLDGTSPAVDPHKPKPAELWDKVLELRRT